MPPKKAPAKKGAHVPPTDPKLKAPDGSVAAPEEEETHNVAEESEEETQKPKVKPTKSRSRRKISEDDDFDFVDFNILDTADTSGGGGQGGAADWKKLMQESEKDNKEHAVGHGEEEEDEESHESEDEEGEEEVLSSSDESTDAPWNAQKEPGDTDSESEEESDPEDRESRRYLIHKHSFLHLKDPGLEDALILKEEEPEKVYEGLAAIKNDYKKTCEALGTKPCRAFLRQMTGEVMDLSWHYLNEKDIIAICKFLCNNTTIKYLYLRGNPAGRPGGDAIAEMIENNYTITHLDLACTEILPSIPKICEALSMNIVIEYLDLSLNELTNKHMKFLAAPIREATALQELYLGRNKIEDQGLITLGKALKDNTSLTILDLKLNEIRGLKDTAPFFEAAGRHPTLQKLNLMGNALADVSGSRIGRTMSLSSSLEVMDVAYNRLGNRSTPGMGKGLASSKAILDFTMLPNIPWNQKHAVNVLGSINKSQGPLQFVDYSPIFAVYKHFLKAEENTLNAKPQLSIRRGDEFGTRVAKPVDPRALVIGRAEVVCENFGTPFECLINNLREEEKEQMTRKDFKKLIKQIKLYKDKKLTEAIMRNFAFSPNEVDIGAIIASYDALHPPIAPDHGDEEDEEEEGGEGGGPRHGSLAIHSVLGLGHIKRERDTSIQAMNW